MTLPYRLYVVNFAGAAIVAYAWMLGYVQQVFEGDISHISYVIVALFAAGLASTFWRAFRITEPGAATRNAHIGDIAEWLVLLGLIGNVVGFLIALHGADISALNTPDGAIKLAGQLLSGLGVAFYSTLAGTVAALWTSVNFRMLETATALEGK